MIVATAGHIDHGKTALVRALTGTDTDRLPEEKSRGITIDLGFAYLRPPEGDPEGGTIGFVDVPGHERLVRTMVAGASGVDLALLVVAADDGVMPQTREHLAVLDLLGLRHGIVALTKADRAGPGRLAEVAAEVADLLAGTALGNAPVLPCSSVTGEGIPEIAWCLRDAALSLRERADAARFRLAVDRAFTLPGVGLIVTGTVHAGRVAAGDRLVLSPAGIEARVRGLHAQNRAAAAGSAGQRVALNITGARLDKAAVKRGDWLVAPGLHMPVDRLDVRLRLLPSEAWALRHRTAVHLHLGAASVMARVALAGDGALAPGAEAFAQLALDAPVGALWGDRFVLRDASAQRTIGGGRVLDPFPAPRHRKRGLEGRTGRDAILAAHGCEDHADALRALLDASPVGLDLGRVLLARNVSDAEAEALSQECVIVGTAPRLAFAPTRWEAIKADLLGALERHHAAHPDEWGATAEELAGALDAPLRPVVAPVAIRALAEVEAVRRTGQLLHLPGREVRLADADAALWDEARAALLAAGSDPPRLAFLAERLGVDDAALQPLLDKLARVGWLCRASASYYLLPEVAAGLADAARRIAAESATGLLTVGRFREATGIARHPTIPVVVHFDRTGLTRRVPEGREIRDAHTATAGVGQL